MDANNHPPVFGKIQADRIAVPFAGRERLARLPYAWGSRWSARWETEWPLPARRAHETISAARYVKMLARLAREE